MQRPQEIQGSTDKQDEGGASEPGGSRVDWELRMGHNYILCFLFNKIAE
jgi:hypothetical protein